MKFLVFSTDLPPIPGFPTSGTALRTWNLAEGLIDNGHEVVYSCPRDAVNAFLDKNTQTGFQPHIRERINGLKALSFDASNQSVLIDTHAPDAIICGHWPAWTLGRKPAQPLIIDLAGPHLLERHYQGEKDAEGGVIAKLSAISCADYFIVSGQKQKLYFLSFMLRAKIPQPEQRIAVIPMPLPENTFLEENTAHFNPNFDCKNPSFIFGGVFLPWQDPSWGLSQLVESLERKKSGSLTMIGGPHPHYPIDSELYANLFKSLKENPYTKIFPLMPYDEFQEHMLSCDIALDLMGWNLERELAITIRSCTYLWSGIPVIYNDYSDLSTLIREYDAGWCVAPGDAESFQKIIDEIYSDNSVCLRKREGAIRLSKEQFNRAALTKKIVDLLKHPQVSLSQEADISIEHGDACSIFITHESSVEQKFVSRIDGLSEVKVLFATYGRNEGADVQISLREIDTNKTIHTEVVERKNISDNQWVSIRFEPQHASGGKTYMLTLRSDEQHKEKTISPWTVSFSPYPLKGLFINGKKTGNNALCIKTISQRQTYV